MPQRNHAEYIIKQDGIARGLYIVMICLKNILKGKVVILCVGNVERGDDGLGPRLAGLLKGKVPYDVIDAGFAPENYTGVIARLKPDTVVIVDAVCFEGEPGEVKIFSGEDFSSGKISTHDVSLKLLIEYLKESTGAAIYMLGIKPESNKFCRDLSFSVKKTLELIAEQLKK